MRWKETPVVRRGGGGRFEWCDGEEKEGDSSGEERRKETQVMRGEEDLSGEDRREETPVVRRRGRGRRIESRKET